VFLEMSFSGDANDASVTFTCDADHNLTKDGVTDHLRTVLPQIW